MPFSKRNINNLVHLFETKKLRIKSKESKIKLKLKKNDKLAEVIFSFCCLLLGVTTMQAPFELYYVELYKRYWEVRTAIRKCIKMCSLELEYLKILFELDELLSSVVTDESIKMLVNELNTDFRQLFIFHKKTIIFVSKHIDQ